VTMDWSAKMLGLSDDFLLEKKKGGGVIMVRWADGAGVVLIIGLGVGVGLDSRHGRTRAGAGGACGAGTDRYGGGQAEIWA